MKTFLLQANLMNFRRRSPMPPGKTTDRARKGFVSSFSHDPRQLRLPFIPIVPAEELKAEESNAQTSMNNEEKSNIPANNHCDHQNGANTHS
jgi:hypothetical protein